MALLLGNDGNENLYSCIPGRVVSSPVSFEKVQTLPVHRFYNIQPNRYLWGWKREEKCFLACPLSVWKQLWHSAEEGHHPPGKIK